MRTTDYHVTAGFVAVAQSRRRDAARSINEARAIETALAALKTRRWREVSRVRLVVGRCYIVRRSWPDYDETPALMRWTANGWQSVFGSLSHTTASICTTEVFG